MSTRPVIFISAVSKELHSVRDLVAKTLLALGYDPKWQDIAPTETGDLCGVLRKWVDDSAAVLQLVGHCYGYEPPEPDPEFGRCSYTQYEALYAQKRGRRVYYIFTEDTHPTDGCGCEPKTLHDLQAAYHQKVKSHGEVYHPSKNLDQTKLAVLQLRDDLAHLRKRHRQHAALVIGLLVVLILGLTWLKRDLFIQQQASTATIQKIEVLHDDTAKKVDALHDDNAKLVQQNDKLLQALRDLPQTLSQKPRGDAEEDEATRRASAYTVLETQLQLPQGTLAKELPQFAQQLLQRADTSALDRANALFATQKFAAAETEALKAKDHALVGQPVQGAIAALQLAGQSAQAQIHYSQAMDYYRAAAALTSPERDVMKWLDLQKDMSLLYHLQGRYPEGLAHSRQVWQTAQQSGKDEAHAVLAAHVYYANALDDNGQAAAAESEYLAVIQIRKRVLGAEHPDTLACRMDVANAMEAQDKHAEAEQEHRAVLQIQERVLGAEHAATLASRNNLANALHGQGKHAEAEQEQKAVLQIKQRVLGAEDTATLVSRTNIALALYAQGKHAEAERENRAVLQIRERVLGADHPDVALLCYNLALCLKAQHKLPEALQVMQQAEQVWTKVLGPEHPHTKFAKTQRQRLEAALAQPPIQ